MENPSSGHSLTYKSSGVDIDAQDAGHLWQAERLRAELEQLEDLFQERCHRQGPPPVILGEPEQGADLEDQGVVIVMSLEMGTHKIRTDMDDRGIII